MIRRKHWYEIRAWADGWEIECSGLLRRLLVEFPIFAPELEYHVVPDSEGWLPWYGGECPVDKDTLVDVKTNTRVNGCAGLAAKIWDWDCVTAYRIFKEADPYAELKAAAKDPTKQIRFLGFDTNGIQKWSDWIDSSSHYFSGWAWTYPTDHYEIRDKPKTKKVKLSAYLTDMGSFVRIKEGLDVSPLWNRVPSEDKEIEIEL